MKKVLQLLNTRPWILPVLIFTILIIAGALMHPLWGDEAETALFARNILKYGVPKGWDGVNIMGINNGVVLDKNLVNHTSPWAQYYLTAASFLILGESSFTARLPSMLLAIVAIVLVYHLVIQLFHKKDLAVITIWQLAVSVGFILFAFQARYYSLTILAGVALVFATLNLVNRSIWTKIIFILSGVAFFYGNYISFAAFFASNFISFIAYWILQKKPGKYIANFTLNYLVLSLVIAACTLPWYLLLKPFASRGELTLSMDSLTLFPSLLLGGLAPYMNNNTFPILMIIAVIGLLAWKLWKKEPLSQLVLLLLIPTIFLFFMTLITVVSVVDTNFINNRYTVVVFPFFVMMVAYVIEFIWNRQKYLGIAVLSLYLLSNVFTLQQPASYLFSFVYEATHRFKTPDKEVADYLDQHARKGDTAFVNVDRDHEPLIFHLKDKIKFVNRVSLVNTRIFPENRGIIPRYIYDFRDQPDWVILFSKRKNDGSFAMFDSRELPPEVNLQANYTETKLNVFFSDVTRPEFDLRSFKEIKPKEGDFVYVYKLKK